VHLKIRVKKKTKVKSDSHKTAEKMTGMMMDIMKTGEKRVLNYNVHERKYLDKKGLFFEVFYELPDVIREATKRKLQYATGFELHLNGRWPVIVMYGCKENREDYWTLEGTYKY